MTKDKTIISDELNIDLDFTCRMIFLGLGLWCFISPFMGMVETFTFIALVLVGYFLQWIFGKREKYLYWEKEKKDNSAHSNFTWSDETIIFYLIYGCMGGGWYLYFTFYANEVPFWQMIVFEILGALIFLLIWVFGWKKWSGRFAAKLENKLEK